MDLNQLMQSFWIIPLISGLFVVFILWRVLGGIMKGQKQANKLLQTGMAAPGQILGVQPTGASMSVGGHRMPQINVVVQVYPPGGQAYQTQVRTYVSELQIPQVQPGAICQVRYDRTNPSLIAIEGFGGSPPPELAGQVPQAAAPMGFGGPAAPAGGGMAVPATPMMRQGIPKAAILSIFIALIGVAVAGYVVMVNVGGVGLDTDGSTGGVCGKAAACCQKIVDKSGAGANADTCKNLKKVGVPDSACQTALDGFKKSAEALKITCD